MANNDTTMNRGPLVMVTEQSGVTVIPQPTPLTRLHYFDGKFLRASDLTIEQLYMRRLMDLSNQAGGPGVAYGYSVSLAAGGDLLNLDPGLAIDPQGRALLLPAPFSIDVQELIDRSRQMKALPAPAGSSGSFGDCTVVAETPPDGVVQVGNLYLIVIGFAEALCGQEDVFGKLCEDACATSTDRPYLIEGLVLRAIPLQIQTPLATSAAVALSQLHLRSRVASAYFADECRQTASFISGSGLHSGIWCRGAEGAGGTFVPLGVLARMGGASLFLDAWIARRERMDPPAKRYWQWRMAMRPWDVFLAQVLQFQCQLSDLFQQQPPAGGDDDACARTHGIVREAADAIARFADYYKTVTTRFTLQPLLLEGKATTEKPPALEGGLLKLIDFQGRLEAAGLFLPSSRVLIDGGIVEVPSAGYLPVVPNAVSSVNEQVIRLLGKGVDLRFCIVRPDFVPHALEEAQHMERISLIEGLDNPDRRPEVDVLVPNGEPLVAAPVTGTAYDAALTIGGTNFQSPTTNQIAVINFSPSIFRGAAHIETPEIGSVEFFTAVDFELTQAAADTPFRPVSAFGRAVVEANLKANVGAVRNVAVEIRPRGEIGIVAPEPSPARHVSLWAAATCSQNFFAAQSAGHALMEIRIVFAAGTFAEDLRLSGQLTFDRPIVLGAQRIVRGTLDGNLSIVAQVGNTRNEQNIRVSHDVTAILSTPDGSAPTFSLKLVNGEPRVVEEILVSWSGNPRRITLRVTEGTDLAGRGESTSRTLFDGTFIQNDDVLLPSNVRHIAALSALDTIGAGLHDSRFSATSGALLFPPPPAPADDLQIRATLDWVLFHRRRTKQCQTITRTPEIPVRRYQLWHGRVANQAALKQVLADLHSQRPFDKEGVTFQPVDVVEFAPGIQTLISPAVVVQQDWRNIHPGQQLQYAAIASGVSANQEGPELARGRLDELDQTLATVTPPAGQILLEVLDAIHPELAAPGLDGVLVALTILQTTCVTVCAVRPEMIEAVQKAIGIGFTSEMLQKVTTSIVGSVQFKAGTAETQKASLDAVAKAWIDQGFRKAADSAVVILKGNPDTATALAQAKVIYGVLEPTGQTPVKEPEVQPTQALPDCPAVLFVAVQRSALSRAARMFVWNTRDAAGARMLEPGLSPADLTFAADGSVEGGTLPDAVVAALRKIGAAAQIELAPLDASDQTAAARRLDAFRSAVKSLGLLKEVAAAVLATVTPAERVRADATINDIIFVKRG